MKKLAFALLSILLLAAFTAQIRDKKSGSAQQTSDSTKYVVVKRDSGGWVVPTAIVKPQHKHIQWSLDKKEKGQQYVIVFKGVDPLEGNAHVSSANGVLTAKIRNDVPRGQNKHYVYELVLIGLKQAARGEKSPPEMIIE
jgi:hypothetical protein